MVIWKIENIPYELKALSKEVSRQDVDKQDQSILSNLRPKHIRSGEAAQMQGCRGEAMLCGCVAAGFRAQD